MPDLPASSSDENVIPVSFATTLGEKYLAYALSTITGRSLPDVRDGLKPVHRRLLWAMLQLKLNPQSGFKKCARVVGDVIGKYHPHGDSAVYDTMVRLAQDFAVRYPLVEGQGNFGSLDGDSAAAMRYTEARLTEVAMAMLQDIGQDTVDFRETYDSQDQEPVVLPAAFPNLLANGAEGIAVGMATSIPPHHVGEICAALLHLIKSPSASTKTLLQHMPGPDFPTGGVIVEPPERLLQAYETGRGSMRVRARWEKEELGHGMYHIVVHEIPYQVNKARLMEKIALLYKEKKLALLGNIRDESTEEVRIILEPKSRTVDAAMLMESLFKLTELESRVSLNMNVLDAKGAPRVMSLPEVLQAFLDHRQEVLVRRTRHRIAQITQRLEILEGLLVAYLNLDEVIALIREEDHPKPVMMKRWSLTDNQAEAILNMRLRSLRKLEEVQIRTEHDTLQKEQQQLEALLGSEEKRASAIAEEIRAIRKAFGNSTPLGKRRTDFATAPESAVVSIEAFVEKEPLTVLCSKLGWIRALKGHQLNLDTVKYKEGDGPGFVVQAYTTDTLLALGTQGKSYSLACANLPRGKGQGDALRVWIDLEAEHQLAALMVHHPGQKRLLASSAGKGFVVAEEDLLAQTKAGKQVMHLTDSTTLVACPVVEGNHVAVIGENRKLLVFPLEEIAEMKKGQGVQLQKYQRNNGSRLLGDVKTFDIAEGLRWELGERTRLETDLSPWLGKRASVGKMPPAGFPKQNRFA